jgi:hypothetical protein
VFEAFSALVTCLQALRADDPDVRRALRVIADDEVRHAALSREIDAFYRATLGDDGRAALDDEHRRATLELAAAPDPVDPEVARRAGPCLAPTSGARSFAPSPPSGPRPRSPDEPIDEPTDEPLEPLEPSLEAATAR